MMDKRVMMYRGDFNGIKIGDLVRPIVDIIGFPREDAALVIDRMSNPLMLGDGDSEHYDPLLIVLHRGRQHQIIADDVELVDDETEER
jgi:hypothetical protein